MTAPHGHPAGMNTREAGAGGGWVTSPSAYCNARSDEGLVCDLNPGHGGRWHEEVEVGRWEIDGPVVQEFVGWGKRTGRRVYNTAAAEVSR